MDIIVHLFIHNSQPIKKYLFAHSVLVTYGNQDPNFRYTSLERSSITLFFFLSLILFLFFSLFLYTVYARICMYIYIYSRVRTST